MDHGISLSLSQLLTAKAVAKHLLESLSENDYVSILFLFLKIFFSIFYCILLSFGSKLKYF